MDDLAELAAYMRPCDRDEIGATTPSPLVEVLDAAVRASFQPGAATAGNGALMCVFGAVPHTLIGDLASPWLLATPALDLHPLYLTRKTKVYLSQVRDFYPRLENHVDARNTASIAWLKALGFTIDDPQPFGYKRLPFHRFHMGF